MGAVRTTFAMVHSFLQWSHTDLALKVQVAAQLVRRAQLISQGLEDPFHSKGLTPKLVPLLI